MAFKLKTLFMKLNLLALSCLIAFGLSSCKKDDSEPVIADYHQNSSSYYPVTKNSKRTYETSMSGTVITYQETITGATKVFDGKTYYEAEVKTTNQADSKSYFYEGNNTYRTLTIIPGYNIELSLEYLNDKEPVGFSWTKNVTPDGTVNGIDAQIIGTIKEKNLTKTVKGKTYNNVIHTQLELQYDYLGTGFETSTTYDFYVAKSIGVILGDSKINSFGIAVNAKTELINYQIN